MSGINYSPKKSSGKYSVLIIGGSIALASILLFTYLMWYVEPDDYRELVKIIAITESGCIAETMDGFSVNIGDCKGQPGQYVDALVDQKAKQRATAMNPP